MPRPLPITPRGPRRARPRAPRLFLACPRIAPDWELGSLDVLMRPKVETRRVVEHRSGEQAWPGAGRRIVQEMVMLVRERLGSELELQFPAAGEYHFVVSFDRLHREGMLALGLLISQRLPGLWLVIDRLFLRAGVFYRRRFGYKLQLVAARDVHLKRPIRAAFQKELTCTTCPSRPSRCRPGRAAR